MNIREFKKGDEIVRTKPAKSLGPTISFMTGQVIERTGDRSYMGEKMIYIGMANGQIYIRRTNKTEISIFGDKPLDLPIDLWEEGWELWVDPLSLTGDETYEKPKRSLKELETDLKVAIETENYEEAERIEAEIKGLED